MNNMYQDDLIVETGFELGMPTHTEMLRHYNSLLEAELMICQRDLLKAHKDIAGLFVMYRDSSKKFAALKVAYDRVHHKLMKYESKSAPPTLGYAYGDYSKQGAKR
jgi:hypothetical protein